MNLCIGHLGLYCSRISLISAYVHLVCVFTDRHTKAQEIVVMR